MTDKYHTALNSKKSVSQEIEGTEKFQTKICSAFKYDFIPEQSLPKEYNECNFLYAEVPYPQGIKIFDKRANIKEERTVDDFAYALTKIIQSQKKPIGIVSSKILHKKLPSPDDLYDIKIHIGKVSFALYNLNIKYQFKTSTDLMNYVANNYKCLGDFCCGYGYPLLQFLEFGGEKIIASDHNSKCISILKKKIEDYEKNI